MENYFLYNLNKYNIRSFESDLKKICTSFSVKRLHSFGSINTDKFGPDSDIDILVKFDNSDMFDPFNQYFGLKENLEKLFNRPVELVFEKKFNNPYFNESVKKNKRIIYEA